MMLRKFSETGTLGKVGGNAWVSSPVLKERASLCPVCGQPQGEMTRCVTTKTAGSKMKVGGSHVS